MRTYLIGAALLAAALLAALITQPGPAPPVPVQQSYQQRISVTPTVVRTVPIASFEARWDPVREPSVPAPVQEAEVPRPTKPVVRAAARADGDVCARHRMVKQWYGKRWRCVKK